MLPYQKKKNYIPVRERYRKRKKANSVISFVANSSSYALIKDIKPAKLAT
jgi:hypothetical protein